MMWFVNIFCIPAVSALLCEKLRKDAFSNAARLLLGYLVWVAALYLVGRVLTEANAFLWWQSMPADGLKYTVEILAAGLTLPIIYRSLTTRISLSVEKKEDGCENE